MEIREEKAAIIGIFIKDFDAVPKVTGSYTTMPKTLLAESVFPAVTGICMSFPSS